MNKQVLCLFLGAALAPSYAVRAAGADEPNAAGRSASAETLRALPLSFEPNVGQAGEQVHFFARAHGYAISLADDSAVLSLAGSRAAASLDAARSADAVEAAEAPHALKLRWGGAARAEGELELPGKVNYLVGDDPAFWRTDVSTFARVRYASVSPGVDLVFYGNGGNLEYDFVLAPGADASAIAMEFEGADSVRLDESGDLVVRVGTGEVRQLRPVVYQADGEDARTMVQAAYTLDGAGRARIALGAYDASKALVVDPVLIYSTFDGGAGSDVAQGVAVDVVGNSYVAGHTSGTFPVTAASFDPFFNGATDAFVAKVNPAGNALVYSTYLGGASRDLAYDVAVDAAGNAYVVGGTSSANYPTTAGAFDTVQNGSIDVFVTKLNAAGNALVYSTFVGGVASDRADAVAIDTVGSTYVVGTTNSVNYPATAGCFDPTFNGGNDVFVTKLAPGGNALVYSTFVGSPGDENGEGIALDTLNQAYITGVTRGAFPVTAGSFDTTFNGGRDVFVTKLNVMGSGLVYSTFVGGADIDYGADIAVRNIAGAPSLAYVTGYTRSVNFPTTAGAFDTTHNGNYDAFAFGLNGPGNALMYATFLGGNENDYGRGIAVDAGGSAHLTGNTMSPNFPVTPGTIDPTFNGAGGAGDAFAARLSGGGNVLLFSTFLGGVRDDAGYGVALFQGMMTVVGYTGSLGYPVTPGVLQPALGGGRDAFVTRLVP